MSGTGSLSRSRRGGSRDRLWLPVATAALVVFLLHGFDGYLSRDLGIYMYAGQQVDNGVPPYLGVLNRAGPLAHLLPAVGIAGARVVGADDLLGARLLFLLMGVGCVLAVYALARDVLTSRLAGLLAAALVLASPAFIRYAAYGPHEKVPMVLLLTCSLLAMHHRRWLWAGVLLSLATLTLQTAFFLGMPALLTAIAVVPRSSARRVQALVQVLVGGLVPVLLFAIYAVLAGSLGESIEAFALINRRYTISTPMVEQLSYGVTTLWEGFGPFLLVLLAGIVGLVVLAWRARPGAQRAGGRVPTTGSVLPLTVGAVAGVLWVTLGDYDGWADVLSLLPLAATGAGGLAWCLVKDARRVVVVRFTVGWLVLCVLAAVGYSWWGRDVRVQTQRASVAAVMGSLPRDTSVVAVQAPAPLVLSRRTNPTRYQMFSSGLDGYVDASYPGGLSGFVDKMRGDQPDLVMLGPPRPLWISEFIKSDYRRIGRAPGWSWYARRSLGHAELSRLRAAAHSSMGDAATR